MTRAASSAARTSISPPFEVVVIGRNSAERTFAGKVLRSAWRTRSVVVMPSAGSLTNDEGDLVHASSYLTLTYAHGVGPLDSAL